MTTALKLSLRLIDPIVLSRTAATTGGHESLDYIPGSALLGAAASLLYRNCSPRESHTLFHSGKVRFSNAYPTTDTGEIGLPMPLSFFHRKSGSPQAPDLTSVIDKSRDRGTEGVQLVQLRSGYITGVQRIIKSSKQSTLRTAIDATTGTAKTSALFDYASIVVGSRFTAFIDVDDDAVAAVDSLRTVFGGGRIRLGRSRSSEYGRVAVAAEILAEDCDPRRTRSPGTFKSEAVRVFCLSDIALFDEYGQPKRDICGSDLGVPGGKIDWSRTHLRHRRYSPFNAALRTWDTERIVIEMGSVFTLEKIAGRPAGRGLVGAYREAGLGQVWYDPPFLGRENGPGSERTFDPWIDEIPNDKITLPEQPRDAEALERLVALAMFHWHGRSDDDLEWAEGERDAIAELYRNAARLRGETANAAIGPQPSQWARIQTLAEGERDIDQIRQKLKSIIERSGKHEGREDRDWGVTTKTADDRFTTFGEWVRSRVGDPDATPTRIVNLARVGLRVAKTQGGR